MTDRCETTNYDAVEAVLRQYRGAAGEKTMDDADEVELATSSEEFRDIGLAQQETRHKTYPNLGAAEENERAGLLHEILNRQR